MAGGGRPGRAGPYFALTADDLEWINRSARGTPAKTLPDAEWSVVAGLRDLTNALVGHAIDG